MISVRDFGTLTDGRRTQLFILDNGKASVYITDFGAHIVSFNVPDKNGVLTDIVLGFDNCNRYEGDVGYIGATVGRFANRIEGGSFALNDITYNLYTNNGPNHLHGGKEGFNHKLFSAFVEKEKLTLSYDSPDMEEGYPGNLNFSVSFELKSDELCIEYFAKTDKDTVVNFTNHAYFNLNGALSEKGLENHLMQINAEAFCRGDENCLATGEIIPVRNTGMDFRRLTNVGERLLGEDKDISANCGIDHNFVLSMQRGQYKKAAELISEDTGIKLECFTDQPGIQIYTSNFLDLKDGKGMVDYNKHYAVCLETQGFPNATEFSYFPSPVLKAGEEFYSKTSYKFSLANEE